MANDTNDRNSQPKTKYNRALNLNLDRMARVYDDAQTMSAVGGLELNNAVFKGDLSLTGAGTAVLNNVVVEGNLTVAAATSLNAANLVVLGNVTLTDGGANTIIWVGGTFAGTLTDVDVHLVGPPSAGDFIAELS